VISNSNIKSVEIVFIVFVSLFTAAMAQENHESGVMFDFSDVEIGSFVKIVSELTGENYVIDPSVAGKITVTSPKPIPREAVPSVFQAVLEVYGFVAVRDEGIIKILPVARARQSGILPHSRDTGDMDNTVQTRVLNLKSADVPEIRTLLQPFLSRAGNISAHAPTRTLIITDLVRNLDRLERVIISLDNASPAYLQEVIPLDHSLADEVAKALSALFAVQLPGQQSRPLIVPEERSNSLLIHASKTDIVTIKSLIVKLDKPALPDRSRVRVTRLHNADAEAVARTLNTQLGPAGEEGSGSTRRESSEQRYTVAADVTTNSLIITASPDEMNTIENVIRQLDLPRKQILVEALIVEISSDLTRELGIEWRLTDEVEEGRYRVVGGTNLSSDGPTSPMQQVMENPYAIPSGIALGLVKGTISFGGVEFANIGALARAMETSSGVNILSTPHILTLDNEEAEIIVGEERPFLKSSQTTDTGTVVRTYEFKDVGLTLRITPRITSEDQIQMKLFQEVKNFVAESDIGAVTTTKRQARTTVRAGDGQMIAIGGLIREDQLDRATQVPCLGNIPFLGYLFKGDRRARTKTNLLIFITPNIVEKSSDLDVLTGKYRQQVPDSSDSEESGSSDE